MRLRVCLPAALLSSLSFLCLSAGVYVYVDVLLCPFICLPVGLSVCPSLPDMQSARRGACRYRPTFKDKVIRANTSIQADIQTNRQTTGSLCSIHAYRHTQEDRQK